MAANHILEYYSGTLNQIPKTIKLELRKIIVTTFWCQNLWCFVQYRMVLHTNG